MRRATTKWAIAAGLCLIAGCATPPPGDGFQAVQEISRQRTGAVVEWNGHTIDDAAVAQRVRAILAGELTAEQAVQIALLNNHHLQATLEDLGVAQADLVQAGLLKNPVFDLGVRFPDRGPAGTYLDVAAGVDFLDTALLPARRKLAAAQFAQARAKVTDEVLSLAAQVRQAFYTAQGAAQRLAIQEQLAEASRAALTATQTLHQAGNVSDLDLTNQRLLDARARIELSNARAAADDARQQLNAQLAIDGPDDQWKLAAHLPDDMPAIPSVDELQTLALRQRQDLAAGAYDVRAQARTLHMADAFRFFPEFNIGPEFEHETEGVWRIGPTLQLPLPLFDQGQAKHARALAILRQSHQRYLALQADIRSQVRQAALRLTHARDRALLCRDQIAPLQQQRVRQMQLQYNGMFVSLFDLLQARRDQIEAQADAVDALRDYWIARAQLERSIGGRVPTPASATLPATEPSSTTQPASQP